MRAGPHLIPMNTSRHHFPGSALAIWAAFLRSCSIPIAFDDSHRPKFTSREHDYLALLYGKFGLPPKPYPRTSSPWRLSRHFSRASAKLISG
jgi:hypothetical protein